jgi:hypothetical protein
MRKWPLDLPSSSGKCGITFRRVTVLTEGLGEMLPPLDSSMLSKTLRSFKGTPIIAEPHPQKRKRELEDIGEIRRFRRVRLLNAVSPVFSILPFRDEHDNGMGLAVELIIHLDLSVFLKSRLGGMCPTLETAHILPQRPQLLATSTVPFAAVVPVACATESRVDSEDGPGRLLLMKQVRWHAIFKGKKARSCSSRFATSPTHPKRSRHHLVMGWTGF